MADVIKSIITRLDTTANWTTLNPTPANGEQCIEILKKGLFKLKIGDGVTPWIALKYATINGNVDELKVLLKREIEERKEGDMALHIALIDGLATKITHYPELPKITEANAGEVAQYIGETTEEFTENYFYKAIYDLENPENSHWERVSIQPETDLTPVWEAIEALDGKVDEKVEELNQKIEETAQELDEKKVTKTDDPLRIYGTDKDGNQVVYDKEDFGKVDDVRINNTSIVIDKIANIEVDSEVTEDSTNLITSGGVYNAIEEATPLYTADEPATVDVGGFSKGDKPENMSFQDFADTLLHKYVDPSITNSISPNKTKYQIGETVDVTMTATITRNAPSKYPFTALAFYSEGVEKKKITDGIDVKTGSWSYKFTGVGTTSKTKYYIENLKATATDTVKSVSTTANIVFVAPTFYGKISVPTDIEEAGQTGQYIQANIETIISNCTRGLETGNVTYNCNLSVEHYIFITPFTVTEIKDTVTSFQYLDSTSNFNYSRTEKGVTTAYKVYYLTRQATGNGYKFLFTVSVSEG